MPPVYWRNATSFGPMFGFSSVNFRPADSASLNEMAPGSEYAGTIFLILRTIKLTTTPLRPSRSPIVPTIMCLILVRGSTFSRVVAKFSKMTMASAPES